MTTIIGLAIASDELRAVAVREGRVHWAARAERAPMPALSAQIGGLLAQAPVARWPRSRAVAAIGPSTAQVKRLSGLPPLGDRLALDALVREGVSRFFLRNGIPLEASEVRVVSAASAWAAAFERPEVDEIALGCRAARLRLVAIIPAVCALGAAVHGESIVWQDGGVRAESEFAAGQLIATRRVTWGGGSADTPPLRVVPALEALGDDGWRYADAFGAAVMPARDHLALRPAGSSEAATSRRRLAVAVGACALASLLALALPGVWNEVEQLRSARQLASLAPQVRDAAVMEQTFRRTSRALIQVARFAGARRSPTALMASLTRALPAGAALIALRADSAGGTLVFLAPRVARVLSALDSVPTVEALEVVGPLTSEIVGARELERATVRFRWGAGRPR